MVNSRINYEDRLHDQLAFGTDFIGRLMSPQDVERFVFAGNATFTIKSVRTGTRFTFRVRSKEGETNFWFVSLLTGADNNQDYTFIGSVRNDWNGHYHYYHGKKCRVSPDSESVKAFTYFLSHFLQQPFYQKVEIWHEGRCGRCGRKLTVPESIVSGFGPECINHV